MCFFIIPFYGQVYELLHEREGLVFAQEHAEIVLLLPSTYLYGVGENYAVFFA